MTLTEKECGYHHDKAFDTGHLQVDDIHTIYYAQYGREDGLSVVYLHGGPGGPTAPQNTKFFNPDIYRVVLWDQRGVGKSLPRNELRQNTTQHLSDDIERLREHLGISKWHMVFGGSWGSTLGLFYTQAYPERVGSLVIRGVLTARMSELLCDTKPIAAQFFPDQWAAFLELLSEHERQDPMGAYYARITSQDRKISAAAAQQWNKWEFSVCRLKPSTIGAEQLDDGDWSLTHALFEAHYLFQNGAWLEDGQLLDPENMAKMKHVPGAIVQGRYDVLCPPVTAWELHQAWPASSLHLINDAGHSANEPGILAKLIQVCDEFAKL